MNKSPLYTRTGDTGTTMLVSGNRVSKSHTRLEAYGTLDELNALIGLLGAQEIPEPELTRPMLLTIQHKLFDLGAYLATDPSALRPGAYSPAPPADTDISRLEQMIDTIDGQLPRLSRFILPGGTQASATAQVARTVCRRAERRITALAEETTVAPSALRYINRLSDFLFALARFCNIAARVDEIYWDKNC